MGQDHIITLWMRRFFQRRDRGATDAPPAQPYHAAAIGALGEALVAGAIRDMGWPVLRNVVLRERTSSAELDLLVRGPTFIAVLEVKTWSGTIDGTARAEHWTRRGSAETDVKVPNAVRQNLVHVRAIERAIGDRDVRVIGLVTSAGHARYCEDLQPHVVPLPELQAALQAQCMKFSSAAQASLDAAWRLLVTEALQSDSRRESHAEWVQTRSQR